MEPATQSIEKQERKIPTRFIDQTGPKGYVALSKLRIQPGNDSSATHVAGESLRLWHVPAEGVVVIHKLVDGKTVHVRRFPLAGGCVGFFELADEPLMR